MPAAFSLMPSTAAASATVSCSKCRRASTSRSIGSMALSAVWSRTFLSARTAASLGRVRCPRSWAARAAEVAPGKRPLVERDLPPRVPHLGPEMVAVQVTELVPGDRAKPEEERGVGLLDIGTEVLPRLEADILDDVGGVDPTLKPRVEPEAHHPAQPRPVPPHQLRPAFGVAGGGQFHQVLDIARVGSHRDHHTILIGRERRW